ncbi:MAG TPA: prepilin-type N-terminal cleavage/methylation domain-containing protein [Planctomycetaceae bacterium]|nr:prepilin-type N-terminal cleavage/methylation domain-containing protein [Planctomycetaceae bacterium]
MHSSRTHLARRRPPAAGPSQSAALRLAFTLLELLIAISIIAVLAGLILTAGSAAMIRAHNAQVSADILSLSTGISAFKQKFGIEPPSSITIYEQGTNSAPSGTGWNNDARSMGIIRQIWPQFDFTYAVEGGQIDINGDGFYDGDGTTSPAAGAIPLNGAECLAFFLGGMPTAASPANHYYQNPVPTPRQAGPPTGFSQSPVDPFNRTGSNRLTFTELDKTRLLLYTPTGGTQHTMNTYLDTLSGQTQPYLYLSSYGGQGYNINELVGPSPSLGSAPGANNPVGNAFVDVYRQGTLSYWTSTSPTFVQNTGTVSPPWNANSYQIISPGGDQQYGTGGDYETATANTALTQTRGGERDNITNFSSGVLAP